MDIHECIWYLILMRWWKRKNHDFSVLFVSKSAWNDDKFKNKKIQRLEISDRSKYTEYIISVQNTIWNQFFVIVFVYHMHKQIIPIWLVISSLHLHSKELIIVMGIHKFRTCLLNFFERFVNGQLKYVRWNVIHQFWTVDILVFGGKKTNN